jgi:hypothetical protein
MPGYLTFALAAFIVLVVLLLWAIITDPNMHNKDISRSWDDRC